MNDDDDLVFPPVCEEDLEVIKQVRMTDISLNTKETICVVSQDQSTVLVQLQQAWESPSSSPGLLDADNDGTYLELPWIHYICYAYRPNNFDEVCFEEMKVKVKDDMVYAKDITIQCTVKKNLMPY